MNKNKIIAFIMLVFAVVFIIFALINPQYSFPWSNTVTYTIYGLYIIVMLVFFIKAFKNK